MSDRVQTGPVRFGKDWAGLFIRGDECAALALAIQGHLDTVDAPAGVGRFNEQANRMALRDLIEQLEAVREPCEAQEMPGGGHYWHHEDGGWVLYWRKKGEDTRAILRVAEDGWPGSPSGEQLDAIAQALNRPAVVKPAGTIRYVAEWSGQIARWGQAQWHHNMAGALARIEDTRRLYPRFRWRVREVVILSETFYEPVEGPADRTKHERMMLEQGED